MGSGFTTGFSADGIGWRLVVAAGPEVVVPGAVVVAGVLGTVVVAGAAGGAITWAPGGGLVVGMVIVCPARILLEVSPLTSVIRSTEVL